MANCEKIVRLVKIVFSTIGSVEKNQSLLKTNWDSDPGKAYHLAIPTPEYFIIFLLNSQPYDISYVYKYGKFVD
jgi:hypothetical protein